MVKYHIGDFLTEGHHQLIERNGRKGKFICGYCGNIFEAYIDNVVRGQKKSCGCLNNLIGKRFGKLIVLKELDKRNSNGTKIWLCQCDCGQMKEVSTTNLKSEKTLSCGCTKKTSSYGCTKKTRKTQDLTDKVFGHLRVLEETDKRDGCGSKIWKCLCDCGKIHYVSTRYLNNGHTQSCGCGRTLRGNLVGQKFNKLTVIKDSYKRAKNGDRYWECLCECGNTTYVRGSDLKSKNVQSCGCLKSTGERDTAKYLREMNIFYIQQKTFKDCINPITNTKLKFDFYLPEYNCCIEYDGIQHFQPCGGWYSEDYLKKIQYRDDIKNQYCKDNNIKLIRIPYTEKNNIKIILKEELNG